MGGIQRASWNLPDVSLDAVPPLAGVYRPSAARETRRHVASAGCAVSRACICYSDERPRVASWPTRPRTLCHIARAAPRRRRGWHPLRARGNVARLPRPLRFTGGTPLESTDALLLGFLWYVLFPVWLGAGVGDYLCHRRSAIEHTSGFRESLLHALQAAELGVPLLAGLLLEIDALVLLLMFACVLAHTATAVWDVSYTTPRRHISPAEQHIHSYLEILPMIAVAIVAIVHRDALGPLAGAETGLDFGIRLKANPAGAAELALVLGLVFCVQTLPLLEELRRTARAPRAARDGAAPAQGRR
jgi:hypothetical protein